MADGSIKATKLLGAAFRGLITFDGGPEELPIEIDTDEPIPPGGQGDVAGLFLFRDHVPGLVVKQTFTLIEGATPIGRGTVLGVAAEVE